MRLLRLLLARRGLLPGLTAVAWVAAAGLRANPASGLSHWACAAVAIALAGWAAYQGGAIAWASFGSALALASLASGGADEDAFGWIDGLGLLGGAIASASALMAVARTQGTPGLTPVRTTSGRALGLLLAFMWVLGAIALALPGSMPRAFAALGPILTLAGLPALSTVERARRALELHAEARLASALAVSVITAVLGICAFVAGARFGGLVARAALPLGCVAVAVVTSRGEPLGVWRAVRRGAALTATGGGVALLMAIFAADAPLRAPAFVLLGVAAALVLGARSDSLVAAIAPESQELLARVAAAQARLLEADPEEAVVVALTSVRSPTPGAPPPELYSLAPPRCAWVDAAGYPHARDAELPPLLLSLAAQEPCGVLRTEALEPLEVRRPDLRALLAWMRDAGVLAAVTVVRAGQAEGALVLPRGARRSPLSLEEVTSLQSLATSLGMALASGEALARSRERERQQQLLAELESDRAAKLEHALGLTAAQSRRATERLARPAAIGLYSAASRLAYDSALRRAQAQAPTLALAPSGVDPIPTLARAHLAGPRADGPFVLVDGTSSREHDPARWRDPLVSPLGLAHGGALVLLDGASLPGEVQQLIAQSLSERRAPWETPEALDVVLALTSAVPIAALIESGRLSAALVARLGDALDAPIELPRLRDRAEDLRAIVTDRLAREGLRLRGAPLGIEAAAFARLVEHPFAGEDAELASICQQLAAICRGAVVRAADVDRLGVSANFAQPLDPGPPVQAGPRAVGR